MPRPDAPEAGWRWFALATLAFGTSYALLPLYSSNQNHHFLIGIARAGEGFLRDDWLSVTGDPFPVFTAFVWFVHRYLNDGVHYLVYYLLLGAYAYGLLGIVERVWPPDARVAATDRLWFLAILCVLHNEVIGYLCGVRLAQMRWWQMTHWGVAEQEIFGHSAFQASSFGLLLPLAIRWFLERRSLRATIVMGAVVVIHFSYAITIASLMLAFMAVEWRRPVSRTRPIAMATIALACALPAAAYALVTFGPSSADVSREAASILARHLPQETDPAVWFGTTAWLQIALMLGGILLAARSELCLPLLVPFLVGAAMTAVQLTTGSARLALLFPWRASVLLVPIATALVIRASIARTRIAGWRHARAVAGAIIGASMVASSVRMVLNFAYYNDYRPVTSRLDRALPARVRADFAGAMRPDTLPMMDFVRRTAARGDTYLIPPELERFRLRTGVPAVADNKSHPYRDYEVLEWHARLRLVRAFYATGDCDVLRTLAADYRVTHVVFDDRVRAAGCEGLHLVYSDPVFDVYGVGRPSPSSMRSVARHTK